MQVLYSKDRDYTNEGLYIVLVLGLAAALSVLGAVTMGLLPSGAFGTGEHTQRRQHTSEYLTK